MVIEPESLEPAPRVLVRTFPPNTNYNYGGVLQAFALQYTIRKLGYDCLTDSTSVHFAESGMRRFVPQPLRPVLQSLIGWHVPLRAIPGRFREAARKMRNQAALPVTGGCITDFAVKHMTLAPLYNHKGGVDQELLASFDCFVAGSDQVWRPEHSNIASYMFDFVPLDDPRPRFSYAVSFVTDSPRFSEARIDRLRALASAMSGISVREISGVDIVKSSLHAKAAQHIDPTMMLTPEDYRGLIEGPERFDDTPHVFDYVLDGSGEARQTLQVVLDQIGLPVYRVVPPTPPSRRELHRNRARYMLPDVDAWLTHLAHSEFAVTDSFHGTVFAILFNVPFVAICNQSRGAARFESLLSQFGLEDRLIDAGSLDLKIAELAPIDWSKVNSRLDEERARSMDYLTTHLPTVGREHGS